MLNKIMTRPWLDPTADGAVFFAEEVAGLLRPQFGGSSAWTLGYK
jgi:hypothetical protein